LCCKAPDNSTLDLFRYNDNLHFALLNGTEGVSLERVDPSRPSDDDSNWHSASEAVGWATRATRIPSTHRTTRRRRAHHRAGHLSPDNDGYQDVLTMTYHFDAPGFTGNMTVFDMAGREVVKLMENELLGTNGAVSWDGIQEDQHAGPHRALRGLLRGLRSRRRDAEVPRDGGGRAKAQLTARSLELLLQLFDPLDDPVQVPEMDVALAVFRHLEGR
jgi:hypothetical protein